MRKTTVPYPVDKPEPLRFRRQNGGQLKVTAAVVQLLAEHRQHTHDAPEAGGVMVGRHIQATEHIIIDLATCPMTRDTAQRTAFRRNDPGHQHFIDARWSESNGAQNYLGDWHTHPGGPPLPSLLDLSEWQRMAHEVEREHDALFFLIATPNATGAFEVARNGTCSALPLWTPELHP